MKHYTKSLTILLIISLAFSVSSFMVNDASCLDPLPPVDNSRVPMPSMPQSFSLSYVDYSYDVPSTTTSTTDSYTGEVTTQTIPGYHVKNFTIDVTIKNQAYPKTIDGNKSILKYVIGLKGAYDSDFHVLNYYDAQPNSTYTTISLSTNSITPGGSVDIRVAAELGYEFEVWRFLYPTTVAASKMSGWTEAKSITIPEESSIQPTPTPTEQPTTLPTMYSPYILPLTIVAVFTVLGASFFVYDLRKQKAT